MYDIAIIGGGPAGMTAAIYALRAGKKTALFEGNKLGGTLLDIKKMDNFPGFKSISGKAFAKRLESQLVALDPDIIRQYVVSISRVDDHFTIYTNTDEYNAKRIIICGGSKRNTVKAVDDFEGSGVSFCATCDGYFYRDKTVAVLGSGYTAEEDVKYLFPLCKKVYLIGKLPVLSKEGIHVEQINTGLKKILGDEKVTGLELKNGKTIEIDGLFVALGSAGGSEYYDDEDLGNGIYLAGDIKGEFKQVVWACAEGARAVSLALKH